MNRRLPQIVSRAVETLVELAGIALAWLINAFTSRRGYSVASSIRYGDASRQALDVYTPDGADAETPVVVYFHGGAWVSGSILTRRVAS